MLQIVAQCGIWMHVLTRKYPSAFFPPSFYVIETEMLQWKVERSSARGRSAVSSVKGNSFSLPRFNQRERNARRRNPDQKRRFTYRSVKP